MRLAWVNGKVSLQIKNGETRSQQVNSYNAFHQNPTTDALLALCATRAGRPARRGRRAGSRQTESSRCPALVGQPRLGLVQGQYSVLRLPRCRHGDDLVLPLGAGHQAPDLRLTQ